MLVLRSNRDLNGGIRVVQDDLGDEGAGPSGEPLSGPGIHYPELTVLALSDEDKRRAADLRRVREAVDRLPEDTLARQVIEAFTGELIKRHNAGELSAQSARLALRPAISLLEEEDAAGGRLPGQAALESYLVKVPGQRAAVSTFLGFLRAKHGLELRLPPKQTSSAARKALEKQITMMVQDQRPVDKRWIVVTLRFFHHLSAAEARAIYAEASSVETPEGIELRLDGSVYWVPKRPVLPLVGSPRSFRQAEG